MVKMASMALFLGALAGLVPAAGAAAAGAGPTLMCPQWPASCEVKGTVRIPGLARPPPGLRVLLNNGELSAAVRQDATFKFHEVPPGRYILEVASVTHFFSQVKLDVGHKFPGDIVALEYRYPGAQSKRFAYDKQHGLQLVAQQAGPKHGNAVLVKQYFDVRQQMSVMAIFQQPMMLMMMFTMGMVFLLPKMMGSIDPEELKKMQAEQGDPSQMLSQLMGGGKKAGDDSDDD
jgi:hypothetical protein